MDPGGDVESTKPSRSTRGGRLLAEKLAVFANRPDVIVLALPRCGVPVGYEVARSLGAPLDVFLVRKLGAPGYEELAMGAIANGGLRVLDDNVVKTLRIPNHVIETVVAKEEKELARRERLYRGGGPFPDLRGRTVLLVDDGLATGATMQAVVEALRPVPDSADTALVETVRAAAYRLTGNAEEYMT